MGKLQPRTHFLPKQSERAFQTQVIQLARLLGWKVAHFRPARVKNKDGTESWRTPVEADGKGFPDLVLVRERVIVAELKSEDARLSESQAGWFEAFKVAGVAAYVWRPQDWHYLRRILEGG